MTTGARSDLGFEHLLERTDELATCVAEALAEVLRAGGARVTHRVTDAGHELVDADLAAAGSWLTMREERR